MAIASVRKGKRRPRRGTTPDDGLSLLAEVIAEHDLDRTAIGWFTLPWRDGSWAAKLAAHVAMKINIYDGVRAAEEDEARKFVASWGGGANAAEVYETAGTYYARFVQSKMNTNTARLLGAALRCMQLRIARSDGGGVAYNEVLMPAFLPIEPLAVAEDVLTYRSLDAIGTGPALCGTKADRTRSAFRIAWQRGLYHAAYSIKPVQ